ncbi:cytochrome P450 monooxygenase pc-bph [Amylocystis lapponica]|nr:cytochrome P450 monooxygenase pc-bph [Amylocystis lapponica]
MLKMYEAMPAFSTIAIVSEVALFIVFAVHFFPYLIDPHGLRAYPGPFFAKFTDAWMAMSASRGRRSEEVYKLHQRFGTFVRLAPNLVSISAPAALDAVYGHSSGTLKSHFYDVFVSFNPGLFSTRSRTVHARKRRIVSHMFAPQSVRAFEPAIHEHISELCSQWDKLCEKASGSEQNGMLGTIEKGYSWFDCTPWVNYFAFDAIGHLAFGETFGMLRSGKDNMKVVKSLETGMDAFNTSVEHHYETEDISAISTLARRAEIAIVLAFMPNYWRGFVQRLPWFSEGVTTLRQLKAMAVAAVARRLAESTLGNGELEKREDMLQRLLEGRDDQGNPMAASELSTEALTLLIAGSDTVSNSSSAIVYYVSRDRHVQEKLQAELDEALGVNADKFVEHDAVKYLPYINAVINEGLRLYSTIGGGLLRVVPEGGLNVLGQTFNEGTVLSVPAYVVHRDPDVWGLDAEEFRPERWLEGDLKMLNKAFTPYSVGPRACIGRNLAQLEMLVLVATIYRRYDTVLEPGQRLPTHDAFIRKVHGFRIGIKRRYI